MPLTPTAAPILSRVLPHCRVVCRWYDTPLIRELYPEGPWSWHRLVGRKQTNAPGPEVLLTSAVAA